MSCIPADIARAAARALTIGLPFAICRKPGESIFRFFAEYPEDVPDRDSQRYTCVAAATKPVATVFEIGPWLSRYTDRITIASALTPAQVMVLPANHRLTSIDNDRLPEATSDEDYLNGVSNVIASCRRRGGKTVYSRIIAGWNPELAYCTEHGATSIVEKADRLFDRFPAAFGFLYYTPTTGCWSGATPETLLSINFKRHTFYTMALAGTRKRSEAGMLRPWDAKNLRENRFVVDFLTEKLADAGVQYSVSPPVTSCYGDIEHLRCDIHGTIPEELHVGALLDSINPTPALCGSPTDAAIADIHNFEHHPRLCYGGFLALHDNSDFVAYVNLRNAHIAPDGHFILYAGGGITPDSDPVEELQESQSKASSLQRILTSAVFAHDRRGN